MGNTFAVSIDRVGFTVTLGQLGYALGLILIVPLGEKYNQRSLIVFLACATSIALAFMALAPNIAFLIVASCVVGLASVIPELIIPFAVNLTPVKERGKVVGAILCGFLIGAPLASALSGFVGAYLGWRTMYWIASFLMIILAFALCFLIPDDKAAKHTIRYWQLLVSLWRLLRQEPVLQEVSVFGILVYAAFNAFWVTISFVLQAAPYHYGSEVVGLFGLVGFAGALAAFYVGKFTDRSNPRTINGGSLVVILFSFVLMWLTNQWLFGLIIGTTLLDLGTQSNLVTNETRIYGLQQGAWSRLNAIYIMLFCIGGSFGSLLGTFSWSVAKTDGVYGTTCILILIALGFYLFHGKRIQQWSLRKRHLSYYRQ